MEDIIREQKGYFFMDVLNTVGSYLLALLPVLWRIVAAVLVLVIGFALVKRLCHTLTTMERFQNCSETVQAWITRCLSVGLKTLLVLVALSLIGIEFSALLIAVAIALAALALVLHGGLANAASGILLAIHRPFQVGDFIMAGETSGVVKEMGLCYTTVITPDNTRVLLPNGTLANSTITNLSTEATRRIDFDFSVAYSSDIDLVRKVLLATAANDENILQDPAPEVVVAGLGEHGLQIKLRLWVASENYWAVYFSLYEDVKKAFDQFGIEVPFPQVDVHMGQ